MARQNRTLGVTATYRIQFLASSTSNGAPVLVETTVAETSKPRSDMQLS